MRREPIASTRACSTASNTPRACGLPGISLRCTLGSWQASFSAIESAWPRTMAASRLSSCAPARAAAPCPAPGPAARRRRSLRAPASSRSRAGRRHRALERLGRRFLGSGAEFGVAGHCRSLQRLRKPVTRHAVGITVDRTECLVAAGAVEARSLNAHGIEIGSHRAEAPGLLLDRLRSASSRGHCRETAASIQNSWMNKTVIQTSPTIPPTISLTVTQRDGKRLDTSASPSSRRCSGSVHREPRVLVFPIVRSTRSPASHQLSATLTEDSASSALKQR